jgi:kynureninase
MSICLESFKNKLYIILSSKIFEEAGMDQIRSKSIILTQYLQYLIKSELQGRSKFDLSHNKNYFLYFWMFLDTGVCEFTLLTPLNWQERGAQLSLRPHGVTAQKIHDELEKVGIVVSTNKTLVVFFCRFDNL